MNRVRNYLKDRSGFTLIELIMVVIIVGVLAAIALPQYAAFKERAIATEAINAVGAIFRAIKIRLLESGDYQENGYTFNNNAAEIAANLGVTLNTTNWTYSTVWYNEMDGLYITATRTTANGGIEGQTIILREQAQFVNHVFTYGRVTWEGSHPNVPRNAG